MKEHAEMHGGVRKVCAWWC